MEPLRIRALHRSPAVSVYDVRCRPSDFARGPEEWSRSNQIVFPRRGVFERDVRGDSVIADPNHVLFFNGDEAYHVAHPGRCGDDCTAFAFDGALVREAVAFHDPAREEAAAAGQPFRFAHALADEQVFLLHARLRQAALARDAARGGGHLRIEEAAVRLLDAVILGAYRSRGLAPPPRKRLRQARLQDHRDLARRTSLHLGTRFGEDLSLQAIARAVHSSPYHLARLFREQTGISIHQYRHRLRLREALRRLADGDPDLTALALDLGFSSHSHLTGAFRRAFGLPPAAYRASLSARRIRQLSRNLEVAALPAP
jgi:AraC family transcriptional regulator